MEWCGGWWVVGLGWVDGKKRTLASLLFLNQPTHNVWLPPAGQHKLQGGPAEPAKAGRVVGAAVDAAVGESPVRRFNEKAAQAFHDTSRHPHVGAAIVKLGVEGGGAEQGGRAKKAKLGENDFNEVARVLHRPPERGDDVGQAAHFGDGRHFDGDVHDVEPGFGQRAADGWGCVVGAAAVVVRAGAVGEDGL